MSGIFKSSEPFGEIVKSSRPSPQHFCEKAHEKKKKKMSRNIEKQPKSQRQCFSVERQCFSVERQCFSVERRSFDGPKNHEVCRKSFTQSFKNPRNTSAVNWRRRTVFRRNKDGISTRTLMSHTLNPQKRQPQNQIYIYI